MNPDSSNATARVWRGARLSWRERVGTTGQSADQVAYH